EMTVRGFRGDSSSHKIYFSPASSAPIANVVSVMTLVGLISVAALSEYILVQLTDIFISVSYGIRVNNLNPGYRIEGSGLGDHLLLTEFFQLQFLIHITFSE
ncbi:hypothetical protein Tco_0848465, partial [Tanacetum coccineum]